MKHIHILLSIILLASMSLTPQRSMAKVNKAQEEAINEYVMKCNVHIAEPELLLMTDTLQSLALRTNDSTSFCLVPLFRLEYYRKLGNEDSIMHYLHLAKRCASQFHRPQYYYIATERHISYLVKKYRYEEARKELDQLFHDAQREKSSAGLFAYYRCLHETFEVEESYRLALVYCDSCLAIIGRDTSLAKEYHSTTFDRIHILLLLKRYDEALAATRDGRNRSDNIPVFRGIYYAYECSILSKKGDLEAAGKALEQTDHLLPNCYSRTPVINAHIDYYKATKQYDKALKWIEDYEKNSSKPNPKFTQKEKSTILFALGGHDAEAVQLAKAYYTYKDSTNREDGRYDKSALYDNYDINLSQIKEAEKRTNFLKWSIIIAGLIVLLLTVSSIIFFIRTKRNLKKGKFTSLISLNKAKDRIENDVVRYIRGSLLPQENIDDKNISIHAGTIPGSLNYNDYYDFFVHDNNIYCIIGEVEGPASTSMHVISMIRNIVRCEGRHAKVATEIASYLNDEIFNIYQGNVTATMLMGIIDLKTGIMSFCNAGHSYPIGLMKSGDEETPYMVKHTSPHRNPNLGASINTVFYGGNLPLKPGDKLIQYSKNLLETEGGDGNTITEDTLVTLALTHCTETPQEMVATATDRITKFLNGKTPTNCLTIVCIEYKGDNA